MRGKSAIFSKIQDNLSLIRTNSIHEKEEKERNKKYYSNENNFPRLFQMLNGCLRERHYVWYTYKLCTYICITIRRWFSSVNMRLIWRTGYQAGFWRRIQDYIGWITSHKNLNINFSFFFFCVQKKREGIVGIYFQVLLPQKCKIHWQWQRIPLTTSILILKKNSKILAKYNLQI